MDTIDSALYILKFMIITTLYLIFVTLTKLRSKKIRKNHKKEPMIFLGIHIDLYIIFIPIYVILFKVLFL